MVLVMGLSISRRCAIYIDRDIGVIDLRPDCRYTSPEFRSHQIGSFEIE